MKRFSLILLISIQVILCNCVTKRTLKSGIVHTYYRVSDVISADTIIIDGIGRVRLIGISVPRQTLTGKPDKQFNLECKKVNESLLLRQWCRFELDQEQEKGRDILAYVFVRVDGEEIFVNAYLIEQGLARFSPSTVNTKYNERLYAAEAIAKTNRRGMWGLGSSGQ